MTIHHFYNYKPYKHHFQELVQLERKEEIHRHWSEIKNLSPQKREETGRAILKLSGRDGGKGLGGAALVKYVRQGGLPDNELSVGDLVIVSTGQPSGKEPQATVTEKTNFSITVAFNNNPPGYALKKDLRLDLFANDITYQRMLEAIKAIKHNGTLLSLVTEKLEPVFTHQKVASWVNQDLNESQKEAVEAALSAEAIFLMHGPPGTGKTTTLVEAIIQHTQTASTLLATADSNTAVDNLVEKLNQQGAKVLRLGNPARINQNLVTHSLDYQLQFENDFQEAQSCWQKIDQLKDKQKNHEPATGQNRRGLRDNQIKTLAGEGKTSRGIPPGKLKAMAKWLEIQEEISNLAEKAIDLESRATHKLIEATEVICTTNATAGGDVLAGYEFDTVFVDEATQSTEPACLISMVKGHKYVMAGDHKQLPPTVLNQQAEPYLQVTLFERLMAIYGDNIASMLDVQYRMNEAIMNFPNETFYEGKLKAHESVANHTLNDFNLALNGQSEPQWWNAALSSKPASIFLDTGHQYPEEQPAKSFSYRNMKEAETLKNIAQAYLEAGFPPDQLGIISPYDEQVNTIKKLMDNPDGLEIKTVDGFQGREKEIILLSFVRSNDSGKLGFLTDYRRMNVAITRARRKLVMIGDAETLAVNNVYQQLLQKVHQYPVT